MKSEATRKLTWGNLARHLPAFFIASFSVGLFIITFPAAMDIYQYPDTPGQPGLLAFIFDIALLMGAFYALLSGPFVLMGISLGAWFDLRAWWFSALWGLLSALLTARLFHDHSQKLDALFYLAVALAGFLAGSLYWLIAVRRPTPPKD